MGFEPPKNDQEMSRNVRDQSGRIAQIHFN